MIGQEKLIDNIHKEIDGRSFARFSILAGQKGSGKKLLADDIASWLNSICYQLPDSKIDTIRKMIVDAYKLSSAMTYIIPDADDMSVAAKNALLKLMEEPPNKAYFIMTLQDINNTLDTIKSRGRVYNMQPYTPEQLYNFYQSLFGKCNEEEKRLIESLCETPGEVTQLYNCKPLEFYNYVMKVIDNISKVSGANAFKIADKIAIKETDGGYDLKLFWKIFIDICNNKQKELDKVADSSQYYQAVLITSYYLKQLKIKGINRQGLMDMWILDIRKEWM